MATVTNTVKLPDGSTPDRVDVVIELVASTTGRAAGWITATDVTLEATVRPTVTNGAWTASLTPNADITPSGSVYKVTEYVDKTRYIHYIEVGSGGGSLFDLLTDAPATVESSALGAHKADTTDAHDASAITFTPISTNDATTVQAAVADLETRFTDPVTSDHIFIDPLLVPRIVDAPRALSIPTYDGSGTVVHPSVVFFKHGWNGWRYWMAFTPYPSSDSAFENPSLVVSNNGIDWQVPPGLTNPIDAAPGAPVYNSDVCLTYDAGSLYCFWRESGGGNDLFVYSRSADGVTWPAQTQVWLTSSAEQRLVSPTVLREPDGTWSMWAVDIIPAPNTFVKLTAPAVTGPWTFDATCTGVSISGQDIWHSEVRFIGSTYVALVSETSLGGSGTGPMHIYTSADGETWVERQQMPRPRNAYKCSFLPCGPNELEVWWGSTSAFWYGRVRYAEPASLEVARGLAAAIKPIAPYTSGDIVDRVNNGSSAGTASSGAAWTASSGTLQVVSNTLGGTAATNQRGVLSVGHADGRFGCRIASFTSQSWLVFRFVDASNYWRFGGNGSNYDLQKVVSGAATTVASVALQAATGDRVEVRCNGSRIVCYVNGNAQIEVVDSANSTGTSYGFQSNTSTARFDQFYSATV